MRAHDVRRLKFCVHCKTPALLEQLLETDAGLLHGRCVLETLDEAGLFALAPDQLGKLTLEDLGVERMKRLIRHQESYRAIATSEWIEVGHVAVRTNSVLVAAKVAASVRRTRGKGRTRDGIAWMCLALFREQLARQEAGQPTELASPRSAPRKSSRRARTQQR